jgi:hypothetical protein
VLVLDALGLDHADGLLDLVPPRQVGAQRAVHDGNVPGGHAVDVVVARRPDAPLHDLEPAALHGAGGEHEAEQLVGGLGPAVPVVRARRHVGRHHVEPARPHQALVVVGRVVGAGHHHAPDALLERGAIHVVGQRHVLVLGPELGVAAVLPGGGVETGRPHVAAVDDGVGAPEVLAVGVVVRWLEYRPSRRSSAPMAPGSRWWSASRRIPSLYSAVNRRRVAFATTSGSGGVATAIVSGVAAASPAGWPAPRPPGSLTTCPVLRVICGSPLGLLMPSVVSSPSLTFTKFQGLGVSRIIDKEGCSPTPAGTTGSCAK